MAESVGKSILCHYSPSASYVICIITNTYLSPRSIQPKVRNRLEYASENYDWRNACHEDEMYRCKETDVLVHPVHVEAGIYSFDTVDYYKSTASPTGILKLTRR